MQQRDYVKNQIEQLGKVLSKIISHFLGLKSDGFLSGAIAISHQQFREELQFDVDKSVLLNEAEVKEYLKN